MLLSQRCNRATSTRSEVERSNAVLLSRPVLGSNLLKVTFHVTRSLFLQVTFICNSLHMSCNEPSNVNFTFESYFPIFLEMSACSWQIIIGNSYILFTTLSCGNISCSGSIDVINWNLIKKVFSEMWKPEPRNVTYDLSSQCCQVSHTNTPPPGPTLHSAHSCCVT